MLAYKVKIFHHFVMGLLFAYFFAILIQLLNILSKEKAFICFSLIFENLMLLNFDIPQLVSLPFF
jgi:hypothetical protein